MHVTLSAIATVHIARETEKRHENYIHGCPNAHCHAYLES